MAATIRGYLKVCGASQARPIMGTMSNYGQHLRSLRNMSMAHGKPKVCGSRWIRLLVHVPQF
jgi:hypothetical protein